MTPKSGPPSTVVNAEQEAPKWRVAYRKFRGTFATWDDLFTEATAFASEVGPERVVNISHSADSGDGVVVVWYLTTDDNSNERNRKTKTTAPSI
jgi:hypothetical protein